MTIRLERIAFEQSRLMEFFSEKELRAQIGADRQDWAKALLKELVDNALDACEAAGIAPVIEIHADDDRLTVIDNGPGLPASIVEKSLDYSLRVSTNASYVAPTRGQLGNALKCCWAAVYVIDGAHGRCVVEANGQKHEVHVRLDQIRQQPEISHTVCESAVKIGTTLTLYWRDLSGYLSVNDFPDFYHASRLIRAFASFNPHATFIFNGRRFARTGESAKWTPGDFPSAHWYGLEPLSLLMANHVKLNPAYPLRDVVAQFRGLSATAKRKAVLEQAGLSGASVSDLVSERKIDQGALNRLLMVMREHSKPVRPGLLGGVGEAHVRAWMQSYDIDETMFRYKRLEATIEGMPYVVECAFASFADLSWTRRVLVAGVNFTAMLENPFDWVNHYLSESRVDSYDPCLLWLHVVSPSIRFTDRGKSRAVLPAEVPLRDAILDVTKLWGKAKRRADRENRVKAAELRDIQRAEKSKSMSMKEAAYSVMEQAYLKASDGGRLPANARQVMYAGRPLILQLIGQESPCKHFSRYFTQHWLPDFMTAHPSLTESWDVVYDDRGNLIEPHTGRKIPLGTLNVRRYIDSWSTLTISTGAPELSPSLGGTSGPDGRYRYALFIEKEGFRELLEKARIAQRFDLAIMSTKGQTVTASRWLVERLTQAGVTILCLHDFDKSGFDIVAKLKTSNRRYRYSIETRVVDLGLRLADIEAMGLDSEPVTYPCEVDPRILLRQQGATEAEVNMLVSGGKAEDWRGRRVELNAMTSSQFLTWLEGKLLEHGVEKVIPGPETLQQAYRRAAFIRQVNAVIAKLEAAKVDIPGDLEQQVRAGIEDNRALSWEAIVRKIVNG